MRGIKNLCGNKLTMSIALSSRMQGCASIAERFQKLTESPLTKLAKDMQATAKMRIALSSRMQEYASAVEQLQKTTESPLAKLAEGMQATFKTCGSSVSRIAPQLSAFRSPGVSSALALAQSSIGELSLAKESNCVLEHIRKDSDAVPLVEGVGTHVPQHRAICVCKSG